MYPIRVMLGIFVSLFLVAAPVWSSDLLQARDAQDRTRLDHIVSHDSAAAEKQPNNAQAQYEAAIANSTLAEVATEVRDKAQARTASEAGMKFAERAIALKAGVAEYHRILGTLCGQAAGATGGLGALKYGRCALDEVNKALELDPKAAVNYLSRGIGNYYLPAALGGGVELAVKDFEKAIELDARSADAHLWLGIALRKLNRNEEAHKALAKAAELDPARVWAKQQLEKTPAR
jgi:tetratricopeptide (TPR) repeat protein